MDEFGSVVFFLLVIAFLFATGFLTGYGSHSQFLVRYECKDERIVDHEVVCYRYDLRPPTKN